MLNVDLALNTHAKANESYYTNRNGSKLEEDVFKALESCAVGTPFENSIQLVSGKYFPDIVANHFYGVEVKSTNKNKWTSVGGSILESTRIQGVERIFLTFGKLGKPVEFLSRPYEECMADIAVTHYPRYKIDMRLETGNTIFDKMGIDYDTLRQLENPVSCVSAYYKTQLKPGQRLWWASTESQESSSAPAILQMWRVLNEDKKAQYTAMGYALFPEVLGSSRDKYQNYTLWLASEYSIINTSTRDTFSAGGKVDITTTHGVYRLPRTFGRIEEHKSIIKKTIEEADVLLLAECWQVRKIKENRVEQWCEIAAHHAKNGQLKKDEAFEILWDLLNA